MNLSLPSLATAARRKREAIWARLEEVSRAQPRAASAPGQDYGVGAEPLGGEPGLTTRPAAGGATVERDFCARRPAVREM